MILIITLLINIELRIWPVLVRTWIRSYIIW